MRHRPRSALLTAAAILLLSAGAARAEEPPAGDPSVFKPGIPGLKMADVRDHKVLWREIDELQGWEQGDRLSIAEFRGKAIEKTVQFLGFADADAESFSATAMAAIASVRESFTALERIDPEVGQPQFDANLQSAVVKLQSQLKSEPRHLLFAPDCKKWLMRLALGPKAAKEEAEAKKAQAGASANGR